MSGGHSSLWPASSCGEPLVSFVSSVCKETIHHADQLPVSTVLVSSVPLMCKDATHLAGKLSVPSVLVSCVMSVFKAATHHADQRPGPTDVVSSILSWCNEAISPTGELPGSTMVYSSVLPSGQSLCWSASMSDRRILPRFGTLTAPTDCPCLHVSNSSCRCCHAG